MTNISSYIWPHFSQLFHGFRILLDTCEIQYFEAFPAEKRKKTVLTRNSEHESRTFSVDIVDAYV